MKEHTQLLESYFRSLLEVRQSGAGVKEESYYDALSNLLNGIGSGLKPRVRCILQLGNRGAGRPDGGLFTEDQWKQGDHHKPLLGLPQPPNRGVIEVKPTSDDVWVTADTRQVTGYWQHYRQVLVTNYRECVLVGQDQDGNPVKLETYRLADNEAEFWAQAARPRAFARRHATTFTEFLHRVMLYAAPLTTPRDVAWFLASYARTGMTRIEGKELPALAAVRSALEEALGLKFVGDKGEHFFRSTFVQTLFYGVFSAWVLWAKGRPETSKDRFEWRTAVWYLRVPMIQALFSNVATPSSLGPLGLVEVLDWTSAVLNRVTRKDFFSAFEEGRAVQYFYEPFLEAFDPELRKELGVWYTPPEVVQYMVARIDTVLREELGLPDGLADPNVYVLDPCCGTGSYLVEVLRCIHRTLQKTRGDALVGSDVKAAAQGRVFGFEILPAPFVVSHLQLGLLLQNLGAPLAEGKHERAGVYLTNALTGWEPLDPEKEKAFQAMLSGFPELLEERDSAREVKREKPILVILGNPPYNAFAGTSPVEEQGLVEPYKEGLVKEWGIKKFNLDDLYVRFFRLAERRIAEQTGRGVVSYISNFSYLADPSFVVMRRRFLSEFDRLWFDSLNGDSRETGKRTPDGKPDPSIFSTEYNKAGIRVGTTVSVLVRKKERDAQPFVRYREFWGVTKRAELLESLKAADLNAQYLSAQPAKENRYSFRPENVSAGYMEWPRLIELSGGVAYQGLAEDRRKALIDIDRNVLEQRMRQYFDSSVTWDALKALGGPLTETYVDFQAEQVRQKTLRAEHFSVDNVSRYAMRPFDTQYCYYTSARPIWRRNRPGFQEQAWKGNAFITSRFKAATDPEGVPISYVTGLCDYHYLPPNVVAVPIRVRERHWKDAGPSGNQGSLIIEGREPGQAATANLSPTAREYLASLGVTDSDSDARTASLLWMHALAIGYSSAYLEENRDGLRQDWPRIPLPRTRETSAASAALGQQVAALLDTERDVPAVTSGSVRPELRVIGSVAREGGSQLQPGDLALTVGWGHHGQSDVVMPGKGKVVERDYTPEEREAIRQGAEALGLSENEAFARLGERTCDVYLNGVAYWRNVPSAVWKFVIGGYQVIKKWLSYREREVLGRPLTVEEVREVTEIARRIAGILLLQPSLDANYQRCKEAPYEWTG
ncbi:MAG: type ISP restriction/modification enzyme [Chloroflexota bacterium]|nr:type ISP restriction/modification enzyme [Chloroflexota bacterium]